MIARLRTVALAALVGCGPAATHPAAQPVTAVPAQHIASEEEWLAVRGDYDTLELGSPERAARRRGLADWLLARIAQSLDGGHAEEAYEQLKLAATLYDASELQHAVDDAALLGAAERVERAFRRRGAHQEVVVALAIEIALAAEPTVARQRYAEVTSWLKAGRADGEAGTADGRDRLIDDLETAARLWPSRFVVDELVGLYVERTPGEPTAVRRPRRGDLRDLIAGGPRPSASYDLARLYLRVSRLDAAAAELGKLGGSGEDGQVRALVEKLAAPTAQPLDAVAVAMMFAREGRDDRDVAERVCRDAARRFPKSPEVQLCAGKLAADNDHLGLALRHLEEAVRLEPTRRESWEAVGRLYQLRLLQLVSDENVNIAAMEAQLRKVEAFHADAQARFPDRPLRSTMAHALFEVGRGYFNAGHPVESLKLLERSVALEPSAVALELMGQVRLKKGDGREAAALFERAANLPAEGRAMQLYWRAKLRRQIADAFEQLGDTGGVDALRRGAIADWDVVLGFPIVPEYAAEAQIEKAKLFYQLGERDLALEAFAKAIDVVPERGNTYADVIAFLVPRGEYEEALDAFHRALGRSEVTDYLKVYCSLWIVDLAHRAGQPEDPLAASFLRSTEGGKWYADLARWATGREKEAQLVERADTPARRAECAFYRAMRAFSDGKRADAQALWREVLATDMMAFFEYDMAAYYLKSGTAPAEPVLKSKPMERRTPTRQQQQQPDGSI